MTASAGGCPPAQGAAGAEPARLRLTGRDSKSDPMPAAVRVLPAWEAWPLPADVWIAARCRSGDCGVAGP